MSVSRDLTISALLMLLASGCASGTQSADPKGWDVDVGTVRTTDGGPFDDSGDGTRSSSGDAQTGSDGGSMGVGMVPPLSTTPLDSTDPLVGGKPPPTGKEGCGKIDFLFVIDNSGSMQDEQQNLIRSFPGFIDTIRNTVGASDHHVLVTDTDASGSMGSQSTTCSGNSCTCTPTPACCQAICASRPNGICNGAACSNQNQLRCDGRLGAGRVKDFNETRCIPDSPRFVTSNATDLANKFSCMARVGTAGDGNERPMQAISEAIGALAQPGQCNQGFLRDDAILVVTFITDEEDAAGKSPGGPSEWVAKLVAAKHGNDKAVVVLGVFGDSDRAGSTCAPGGLMGNLGADPGYRLREFVESFKYGVAGSVCAADYTPFLQEAVKVIDSACDGFTR